jgi:SMC interacting uncharacterized protein involved in chromosome segregation
MDRIKTDRRQRIDNPPEIEPHRRTKPMALREKLEEELKGLRATRDELRVRLHLGKLDAQDQWEQIEKQWQQVESKLKVAGETGREVAEDLGEAASLAVEELKEGYAKLRKLL